MEQINYSDIIKKIGPQKDLSRLTEEELLYYDSVRAIKCKSADEERKIIQQEIKKWNHQIQFKTNKNPFIMNTSNKTWIGIAAGVAIIVAAYFFLWDSSKSMDEIYDMSFKTETENISKAKEKTMQYGMVDVGVETRDSFLKGLELYEKNDYDEAMKIFTPYVETYPEDHEARFYLSMAQMNREKYAPALTNLSVLNATKDLEFSEDVKWYYALCLLKMVDGRKMAKVLFEQLAASEGKYSNAARANLNFFPNQ